MILPNNRLLKTRLLSPFVIFTILMMIKVYLYWFVIYGPTSILKPIVTGLPAVLIIYGLIERFATRRKLLYYMIGHTLLTSLYFTAIMYFKYYGTIVNHHALEQANQVVQVKGVFYLMHPQFLLIFTDIIVLFVWLLVHKASLKRWIQKVRPMPRRTLAAFTILSLLISASAIWSSKDIVNEIKMAERMGLVNYELYTIFASSKKEYLTADAVTPVSINNLKQLSAKPKEVLIQEGSPFEGIAEGKNLIVIQMESLQSFVQGLDVNGQALTPHLDALRREAYYYPNIFQQVGQGKTSDSEFVMNTSIHIPTDGAAAQQYADRDLPSLPKMLQPLGYQSMTFHTNHSDFWNRKQLYPALGFTRYYDDTFFGNEDVIHFSASDKVLFKKTAEELANQSATGQPFYAQLITLTNHHPFTLPEDDIELELPEAYENTLTGAYLQSVHYFDQALGDFIAELKHNGLWENSIIVLYGDHMGLPLHLLTKKDQTILEELLGRPYNYVDMLNIPLIIALPGEKLPYNPYVNQVGGHVDLLPTIAHLIGADNDSQAQFGTHLFQTVDALLPMRYFLPTGSFINNEGLYIPGEGIEDGQFIPLHAEQGPPVSIEELELSDASLADLQRQYDRALYLFDMAESFVQYLPLLEQDEEEDQQEFKDEPSTTVPTQKPLPNLHFN